MAAREGSYGACRALLDAHANREITDHMERLPRDVAAERVHDDIVRLLDEHAPSTHHPQRYHTDHHALVGKDDNNITVVVLMLSIRTNYLKFPASPNHHQLISHPTVIGNNTVGGSKHGKSKKQRNKGSPNSPGDGLTQLDVNGQPMRRYLSNERFNQSKQMRY